MFTIEFVSVYYKKKNGWRDHFIILAYISLYQAPKKKRRVFVRVTTKILWVLALNINQDWTSNNT